MIPVNTPLLDGNEKKYLMDCIETGWISSEGPYVTKFEKEFAARMGRKYGVAVCNGSIALDLSVVALGIGEGDEVILPSFTIISCASAIVRAGAIPVVVDCDPATWNMDVTQIKAKITPRTKAIMAVHMYGLPVEMTALEDLAKEHGLAIIEDAAESHGLTYKNRPCGSFGDISTFSFYPNKHITTGEGGMVLMDDPALYEKCKNMRNLCFGPKRFVHEELGWNYRMTNLQAALGVAQLERLDSFLEIKKSMGAFYTQAFQSLERVQLPLTKTAYAENNYWVFGIVLNEQHPLDAEQAMRKLADVGIGTRPFFWPMHEQPVFKKMGLFAGEKYPHAEKIARRGFYIPSGLGLTKDEWGVVAEKVKQVLK